VLTKVDCVSTEIRTQPDMMYSDAEVHKRIEAIVNILGIAERQVFPVVNYTWQRQKQKALDVKSLAPLEQALSIVDNSFTHLAADASFGIVQDIRFRMGRMLRREPSADDPHLQTLNQHSRVFLLIKMLALFAVFVVIGFTIAISAHHIVSR